MPKNIVQNALALALADSDADSNGMESEQSDDEHAIMPLPTSKDVTPSNSGDFNRTVDHNGPLPDHLEPVSGNCHILIVGDSRTRGQEEKFSQKDVPLFPGADGGPRKSKVFSFCAPGATVLDIKRKLMRGDLKLRANQPLYSPEGRISKRKRNKSAIKNSSYTENEKNGLKMRFSSYKKFDRVYYVGSANDVSALPHNGKDPTKPKYWKTDFDKLMNCMITLFTNAKEIVLFSLTPRFDDAQSLINTQSYNRMLKAYCEAQTGEPSDGPKLIYGDIYDFFLKGSKNSSEKAALTDSGKRKGKHDPKVRREFERFHPNEVYRDFYFESDGLHLNNDGKKHLFTNLKRFATRAERTEKFSVEKFLVNNAVEDPPAAAAEPIQDQTKTQDKILDQDEPVAQVESAAKKQPLVEGQPDSEVPAKQKDQTGQSMDDSTPAPKKSKKAVAKKTVRKKFNFQEEPDRVRHFIVNNIMPHMLTILHKCEFPKLLVFIFVAEYKNYLQAGHVRLDAERSRAKGCRDMCKASFDICATTYLVSDSVGELKNVCLVNHKPHTDKCKNKFLTEESRRKNVTKLGDMFFVIRDLKPKLHWCGPNTAAELFASPESKKRDREQLELVERRFIRARQRGDEIVEQGIQELEDELMASEEETEPSRNAMKRKTQDMTPQSGATSAKRSPPNSDQLF